MKTRYKLDKAKFLSDAEFSRLERKLVSLYSVEPRNSTLLALAIHTGARAQELLNLRRTDLDREEKTVYIRGLKGSDDRYIPLPEWLFKQVEAELLPGSKLVFPISYARLDQIWRSIRPVDKKFHSLRHTFAIRTYRRTKDIYLVKKALGHRSIANTMIYMDFEYTNSEMRKLLVG